VIVRRYAGHVPTTANYFFPREHGPRQTYSAPEPASRTRPRRILPTTVSRVPADSAILWNCFPRRASIEWAKRLIEGCLLSEPLGWVGHVSREQLRIHVVLFLTPVLDPGNGALEVVDN